MSSTGIIVDAGHRQLYRRASWPFWAAAFTSAIPFALGHVYQSSELNLTFAGSLVVVIASNGLSAAFAAWVLMRWEFNLWILISCHALSNLWWYMWGVGQQEIYGVWGNVLRVTMLLLIAGMTLRRRRDGLEH